MQVDEAFKSRVVGLIEVGPNSLGPQGLRVLSAEVGRRKVTWSPGVTGEVPTVLLRYLWRGEEGDFEFPLVPGFWGGFDNPSHVVDFIWIDLHETLTALD